MELRAELEAGLRGAPKAVPVPFLYDATGSRLYTEITGLPEYTPYRDEVELFGDSLDAVVAELRPGAVLVELGAGDGSKICPLLRRWSERDGAAGVRYCAIDCSAEALRQMEATLREHCPGVGSVTYIEADYLAGVQAARKRFAGAPLCLLFIGSSVGNFPHDEAVQLLRQLRTSAGNECSLLLGCDLWKERDVLHAAYDDSRGVTAAFIENGMRNALRTLGHPSAEREGVWEYDAVVNAEAKQVEMYLVAREHVADLLPGLHIEAGERILMEISRKFTPAGLRGMAFEAGFCCQATWERRGRYSLQLLLPPLEALERSWADTDSLFACLKDWSAQPIGLRRPFGFYAGHVAAFTKLRLMPEESEMDTMLSRGIDPLVLDPATCHPHPAAPDVWPSREELLKYIGRTRSELRSAVGAGSADLRALVMSLEHERMHQETLCYMLAQQRRADWLYESRDSVASASQQQQQQQQDATGCFYLSRCSYAGAALEDSAADAAFIRVPGGEVRLGSAGEEAGFQWDNEGGALVETVGELLVASHPITVLDYFGFLKEEPYSNPDLWDKEVFALFQREGVRMPATWSGAGHDIYIHLAERSYHWEEVADCPVYVCLAEAAAYAKRFGARLMTEAEYQNCCERPEGAGIKQLAGGGWEWCNSSFKPFPGFEVDPAYPEYSQDFYDDGIHLVLKGGSEYTHPSLRRSTFRNFYQAAYRPVFASFRLVRE